MKLKDKVAVVTGGGRGIGRAIALLFAQQGASVTVASRTLDQVEGVVAEIGAAGGKALGLGVDVAIEDNVKMMVDKTAEKFGGVDILVNNAGINNAGPIVVSESDDWRRVIEVNLFGAYYCAKAVAPILMGRGWGRIINMASRSGKIGHPSLTAYCASKHGLVGMTKALAEELAPFGITANAICPGLVETDMIPDTIREEVGDKIIKPSQIAELALYLASDAAAPVNGESIDIFGSTKLNISI
jgi:fengycin family lipopeptide synthetase B